MARQRSHSIAFKRQVAQEFIAGESLYALSKRHDISRQLIRVWVEKYEAGALDEDAQAADLLQEYEAKIAALERMVGRQALEIEFLREINGLHGVPKIGTTLGTTTIFNCAGSDKAPCKGIEITCEFVLGQFSVGWFVCFLSNWGSHCSCSSV